MQAQAIPTRASALQQKHQALTTLSRLNHEGIVAKKIMLPEHNPGIRFPKKFNTCLESIKRVNEQIFDDVEHGAFGSKDYELLQLEPSDSKRAANMANLFGRYFPSSCIETRGDSPPCIYFSPSIMSKPSKADTPRQRSLKQLYEAIEQLSDTNGLEIDAGIERHTVEHPQSCWTLRLKQVDALVHKDVEAGCFGSNSYCLLELHESQLEHSSVRLSILGRMGLQLSGPWGVEPGNILIFYSQFLPRSCLTIERGEQPRVIYNPKN